MFRWLCVSVLLAALAAGALAQAADPDSPGYPEREFALATYLWGAEFDGMVEADRASVDLDASFSDIWEQLNIGVMLAGAARVGRFVALLDGIWLELEDEASTRTVQLGSATFGPGEVDTTLQEGIGDLKLGYRILEPDTGARQPVSLDLLAGGRYWYMKTDIDAAFAVIANRSVEESQSWVDPIVGFRAIIGLSPKLQLVVIGDVGGWGAGEASDHTWQAMALLGVQLSEAWSLRLGYRALDLERGLTDIEMKGPIFGGVYRF
jgi:hypothetical protein